MRKLSSIIILGFLAFTQVVFSQDIVHTDSTKKIPSKIILVPYQPMMYFSDADRDIARYSSTDENTVRKTINNNIEIDTYHKLLAHFNAISLVRATSLDGEEDLRRIYAATGYTLYKAKSTDPKPEVNNAVKNLIKSFKKNKEINFIVTDSSVMLANIQSDEVFRYLHKKHNEKYVLFITQFEMNTSNKNTIEWTKQAYVREYILHYNLFDFTGKLIRAETLTLKGTNENKLASINSLYLNILAEKLVSIIEAVDQ